MRDDRASATLAAGIIGMLFLCPVSYTHLLAHETN